MACDHNGWSVLPRADLTRPNEAGASASIPSLPDSHGTARTHTTAYLCIHTICTNTLRNGQHFPYLQQIFTKNVHAHNFALSYLF